MSSETRGSVFFKLPLRYATGRANPFEPFVAQPSCGAAISGVAHNERFVTVSGNFGLIPQGLDRFDAV